MHDVELVDVVDEDHPKVEEPDPHHQLVPDRLLLIHRVPKDCNLLEQAVGKPAEKRA